jgi:hypothetical protein
MKPLKLQCLRLLYLYDHNKLVYELRLYETMRRYLMGKKHLTKEEKTRIIYLSSYYDFLFSSKPLN